MKKLSNRVPNIKGKRTFCAVTHSTGNKSDGTSSTGSVAESESRLKVIDAQDIKDAVHERLYGVPTLAEVYGMMRNLRSKVGQLNPIILDNKYRLITGLSRALALRIRGTEQDKRAALIQDLLKQGLCTKSTEIKIEAFEKLAYDGNKNAEVRVFDFDSSKDQDRVQKIEISENSVRKRHGNHAAIITRLKYLLENGYKYESSVHKAGYKSAKKELAKNFGCSEKTIQNIINENRQKFDPSAKEDAENSERIKARKSASLQKSITSIVALKISKKAKREILESSLELINQTLKTLRPSKSA